MNANDTISDETLMAYADAQLDAAARLEVERALAVDASLAARLSRYQRLTGHVKAAYDGVLSEPVPERLLRALQTPLAEQAPGQALAPSRTSPPAAGQGPLAWLREQTARLIGDWAWPQWSAAAASLAVAVALGALLAKPGAGDLVAVESGHLLARGALARALATQASGAQVAAASVQLNVSFRNRSGEYCRAFSVSQAQPVAGVACREGGDWRIDTVSPATAGASGSAGYRQAASELPAAVTRAIEQQISGEPLDAEGEAAALRQGWK